MLSFIYRNNPFPLVLETGILSNFVLWYQAPIPSTIIVIMNKGLQQLYSGLNRTYELVNHVLTFGLDIRWRKKAAKAAARAGGTLWLDVCCGTGEMAIALSHFAHEQTHIIAADFTEAMLFQAREKLENRRIVSVIADSGRLPFLDGTFDMVTISFATRNINPKRQTLVSFLREFRRVLKSGGRFVNLETSRPRSPVIRALFHAYVKTTVKPVGTLISGSRAGYAYLSQTIPCFYDAEEFSRILEEAGFRSVSYERLLLGVAAIHQAWG